ncbi:hypothetical protein VDGE_09666 [Verticillium dahliae]|uniref:DUF4604 domain-containing protein n=1 Tax=Verticillium dahliae TaxID=27337 RepID=A0A444S751_VERDA|nr:hypothetical protein VDGE_09666 [Verticillium dahliae]
MPEPKINAKSLSYSSDLPPFLRALHAQSRGDASAGPDPILAGRRRAIKKRSASEEAEDQPLVVDENGNVVTIDDDRNDHDGPNSDSQAPDDASTAAGKDAETAAEREKEKVAGIGAGRKRKVGKIVGADGEKKDNGVPTRKDELDIEDPARSKASAKDKPKKKAKKIKLSFDPE